MNNKTKNIEEEMIVLGNLARAGFSELSMCTGEKRNSALIAAAAAIRGNADKIIEANKMDMESATNRGLTSALLDRLMLDEDRVEAMAVGLDAISELPDPVGKLLAGWDRPNGLNIERVSVPLGVIGIIYESRPNVTADAAALCLKSGNAVILRGGSESFESNQAIFKCMREGLKSAGVDENALQFIGTRDRSAVGFLLSSMAEWVDVIVPRGGKSLIKRVQDDARVPVIGHLEGICHVYLHSSAELSIACNVVLNAKMRRTGICGAAETLLIDADVAPKLLPEICKVLINAGCEIRADETAKLIIPEAVLANESDWYTEYLDAIISIRVVDNIDGAISHIAKYSSGHTESIIASDQEAAEHFLHSVDSAIVMHNTSTQFADGGEFGMGAEIGIATGRVHTRGPVGAEQLTSYKYVVRGSGQTRP
ncbi:MAG: glutamate-5-semialdehyde dehydrogenase [Gammaproteobacteria bacterium]|nr:glutamate-5-semialdehyde dehydrogenase [Gammaproteobacteria bacterium]|tara:strand:+ start:568 stop:1842 length:1275 start_codon:yes stop_codon:yes gene_type:complete